MDLRSEFAAVGRIRSRQWPPFVARTLPLFYSLKPGQLKKTFDKIKTEVPSAEPAHVAQDSRLHVESIPTMAEIEKARRAETIAP